MLRICIAFALCLSVAHAATLPYERPLDADCVSINGSNSQVAYITPQTYYLTGASSASEPGYTTVSLAIHFALRDLSRRRIATGLNYIVKTEVS